MRTPERVEPDPPGRWIAQRGFDERRVLRVLYRQAGELRVIAEQTGPFIAHFDPAGQLVLLEVLDASDFLASLVKVTARGTVEELPAGG